MYYHKTMTMKHLVFACYKQCVALTGRDRTGPPWSVGRPSAHAPGWPTSSFTDPDRQRPRRQTTTTDIREQNNTGPLSGPVITQNAIYYTVYNLQTAVIRL